jgi:hypothetical protein
MKFLKFLNFRKEKTTEELFNKCEESFYEFCSYIHLSHTRDFHEFKKKFAKDADYCIAAIVEVKEDALKRKLINHLQKQVDYLQQNSFGPNSRIKFREFLEANYPYEEKVNEVITNHKFEKAVIEPLKKDLAKISKQKM